MADDAEPGTRTRTPGIRYPGASIPTVLDMLRVLDGDGGASSIGRVAARLDMTEGAATFKRVLISARNYGLAEWGNTEKTVMRLTPEGQRALAGDQPTLRRALILPPAFRAVARRFAGRTLPADGLAEAFRVTGVAPAGSGLASDNFIASAEAAGALSVEAGRRLMSHDLPFEAVEAEEPQPVEDEPAARTVGAAGAQARGEAGRVGRRRPPSTVVEAPPPTALRSAPRIELRVDVSNWTVDQVIELARRLRDEGLA
jgi:hypothetical protein